MLSVPGWQLLPIVDQLCARPSGVSTKAAANIATNAYFLFIFITSPRVSSIQEQDCEASPAFTVKRLQWIARRLRRNGVMLFERRQALERVVGCRCPH